MNGIYKGKFALLDGLNTYVAVPLGFELLLNNSWQEDWLAF